MCFYSNKVPVIYSQCHFNVWFFSLVSSFLFVQQIQYGRRSIKPPLRTQPASCLLSQTGLRCHGNMLWRSTYWDSAGWRVTVLAVWVSGPLFPTNILPFLRTCNTQQFKDQSRFAFVSSWLHFVCLLVCSTNATLKTSSSDIRMWCAIFPNFSVLCCLQSQYRLLGFTFHSPHFIAIVAVYCHDKLSGNSQFVIRAYDSATPSLTLTFKVHIKFFSFKGSTKIPT